LLEAGRWLKVSTVQRGTRRQITGGGGAKIGGAPISYVAVFTAIVAALAFIPASIVIGSAGGGWPLHDAIHPLVGLVLGPIAGPISSIVGIFIGNAIAPYTSLGPWSFVMGGMSAFAVAMVTQRNKSAWLVPWVVVAALHVVYYFQATNFGISPWMWLSNAFAVTLGLILIAIPAVRKFYTTHLRDQSLGWRLGVALYLPFFFGSVAGMQALWVPSFATNPWPAEVWPVLVPIILLERTIFPLIGTLVALGVIAGLRRSSIVKPEMASY
jgi:uncharacterized membrane protein